MIGKMSERSIKDLYQSVILQHERQPFHYYKMDAPDVTLQAYNPVCGDQFQLFLKMEGQVVTEVSFQGYGCAISKASTSILAEKITGLSFSAIQLLVQHFQNIVTPDGSIYAEADPALQAFAAARQFPERLQCATLSWQALEKYLLDFM